MSVIPEITARSSAPSVAATTHGAKPGIWHNIRLAGEILYRQIDRDRLFTQASALTYKTLFSLLPVFVLSLLILSLISAGQGKNALDVTVQRVLFEELGLEQIPMQDDGGHQLKNARGQNLTFSEFVEPYITRAKNSVSGQATTTGLIAFAVLLYAAISLMIVIESTFNLLYGLAKPRPLLRRIMLYWCVLTLGPVGIAGSIVLGHSAYDAAHSVGFGWFLSTANLLSDFIVFWLLILLMYRVIPDARVKWRPALVGSFFAAVAWEISKWAFGLYVLHAVHNSWYGSFALLPLFMLWIYLTWSVVLIGLKVAYVQQYWTMLARNVRLARASSRAEGLSDIRWVLPLGALLYQRFKAGKTLDAHQAADSLALLPAVTAEMLQALEKAGVIHIVKGTTYALARPAESITAYDLLTAARSLFPTPADVAALSTATPGKSPSAIAAQRAQLLTSTRTLDALETDWAKHQTLIDLANA